MKFLLAICQELRLADLLVGFLALLSVLCVALVLVHLLTDLQMMEFATYFFLNHLLVSGFTVWVDLFRPDDVALLRLSFEELLEAFTES